MSEHNVELARRGYEAALRGELVDVVDAGDQVVVFIRPPAVAEEPAEVIADPRTLP
jgi:predicted deacylase